MDADLHKELSDIQRKLDQCVSSLPLISKHEIILFGDEDQPAGLLMRLDRVEQKAKQNKWVAGLAFGGFFTAIGEWVARRIWS